MSREKLLHSIWKGDSLDLNCHDLTIWPEIQALESTPQDPAWHAEGNVLIHTNMVLNATHNIEKEFSTEELGLVRLSCLFHDIEKPRTTLYSEELQHTIAPGHERMGGVSSRYYLYELPSLESQMRRLVSHLVATHHLVKRSVKNIDSPGGRV